MSQQESLEGPFEFFCFKCETYNRRGIKIPKLVTLDASRVFARKTKHGRYQLVGRHIRHHAYKFTTKEIYDKYKKVKTTTKKIN